MINGILCLCFSEAFMNMGSNQGRRGATPRGSTHRTSFIEYVSEVYNSRTAAANSNQPSISGQQTTTPVQGRIVSYTVL